MHIQTIAVLGAGVMGSQIALEFAKYNYNVYLFDQTTELVQQGITKTCASVPSKDMINGIAAAQIYQNSLNNITFCNYIDDLEKLRMCDLVIEAIVEIIEVKQKLYTLIKPYLNNEAILATNSSGLNIEKLAQYAHKPQQFCGLHFFNPPRYLPLVEYITYTHQPKCDAVLESLMQRNMHFQFLKAKNSPNFIANRIGFFAWLLAAHYAEQLHIDIDIADALSGIWIGRAKSATYRTADIVGLDVTQHVLNTLFGIDDENFKQWYTLPKGLVYLLQHKYLGQKTKCGFYKKEADKIMVWNGDITAPTPIYREAHNIDTYIDAKTLHILKQESTQLGIMEKIHQLKTLEHAHAKYICYIVEDLLRYIEQHTQNIAYNKQDIIKAMQYGFNWSNFGHIGN
jgi:3-hydroxyacyl-CoA dehydrogenase